MVPISGVVTIDGEPAQFVKVILGDPKSVSKASGKNYCPIYGPSGVTDENGAFSITTKNTKDGALPGDYKVVFEWLPPGVSDDLFEDGTPPPDVMKRFPPKLEAIHEKYAAGKTGNIDFKVEAKKPQQDVKFELTTK